MRRTDEPFLSCQNCALRTCVTFVIRKLGITADATSYCSCRRAVFISRAIEIWRRRDTQPDRSVSQRSQAALPQDCEPMAFSSNLPLRAARTCGTVGLSDGRNLVVVTKRRLDMRRLARLHCSAQPTQWRTSAHARTLRRKQRAHTDSAKSHSHTTGSAAGYGIGRTERHFASSKAPKQPLPVTMAVHGRPQSRAEHRLPC